MNSPAINTLERSKHFVPSGALVLATMLFAVPTGDAQQLQKGISVQLAVTSNAAPMPDADSEEAWIVAVAADGRMYFGIDPVTPEGLADKMKSRPHDAIKSSTSKPTRAAICRCAQSPYGCP